MTFDGFTFGWPYAIQSEISIALRKRYVQNLIAITIVTG